MNSVYNIPATRRKSYPLVQERLLVEKVKSGDRAGAREILNNLLGSIIFSDPGNFNVLKARMLELLTILSRAAIEAGADAEILLSRNQAYIATILKFTDPEQLCAWIARPLEEFIEHVSNIRDKYRSVTVNQTMQLLETRYAQPITLGELARQVKLSPSRLGHLFKERTNTTISDYLKFIRIENAKKLLLNSDKSVAEVGRSVGYPNQSYFTRTFGLFTGLTPRQFRKFHHR